MVEYLCNLLGILLHGRFTSSLLFTNLFSVLFISVWTHVYLFYTLSYNLFYFYAQVIPSLDIGSSCMYLFMSVSEQLLNFWHFKVHFDSARLFTAPVLESAMYWKMILEISIWVLSVFYIYFCFLESYSLCFFSSSFFYSAYLF